ncbi:hypothetical protein D3C73_1631730 [compost metagenome]
MDGELQLSYLVLDQENAGELAMLAQGRIVQQSGTMARVGEKELDNRLQPKGQPGFFAAPDGVIASRVCAADYNSF